MPLEAGRLRVVYLVARREFLTRVRTRFFLIGTLVLVAIMVGYITLQATVFNRIGTSVKVAFDGQASALAQPLVSQARSLDLTVKTTTAASVAAGQAGVRDGTYDALVYGDPAAPDVAVQDTLNPQVQSILTDLVRVNALDRALVARGVSPAGVTAAVAAAGLHVQTLDAGAAQRTQRYVSGLIVAILLYVILLMYGQIVASGVVEEKANRIVEILLATIRPRELLFGKVIGIGLVGLTQLVVVGAAGLVAITKSNVISLPGVGVDVVLAGLLWFVLGFLLYALLYAAAGSLVSRQEDLGAVLAPLSMLVVGTYLAFFWVVSNPGLPAAVGLSMLPPFAPILMPARMATGDASVWQVLLAIGLIVPTILAVNALGARIYSNSVMRTGARVSLRDAWAGRP